MKRMKNALVVLFCAFCMLFLMTGCKKTPIPEGMDEQAMLETGRAVITLLNDGEYDELLTWFREDIQAQNTAQDMQEMFQPEFLKAGEYKKEEKTLINGRTDKESGEEFGVAVFYCKHAKDDVLYQIAFDKDMLLIGLSVKTQ